MGQISAYQEAPYQGVSQAPPQVRRRDQAEALEDCIVAMPEGLQKRPPLQYIGILAGHPGSTTGVMHHVERSAGDAIFTLTREGAVTVPRVYYLSTLAAQAVTIDAAAQTYVNASVTHPQHNLGCNTVVDFTFTWNRTQVATNSADTQPVRDHEGMIWVRAGAYAKDYRVSVTGGGLGAGTHTYILHTPDGTSASDGKWVDTDVIAASLISGSYTAVNGAIAPSSIGGDLGGVGFTVTQVGPVISITYPSAGGDFSIDVSDGQGGNAMLAVKDKVQSFSDLPKRAPDGFTVRIVQQSGTENDDYFVQFEAATKTWKECLAPAAQLGLDKETMPMGLVFSGGWQFKVLDWKQRATGNESLVRDPDFVGQVIQDVTFWQGRLGIVSGEGVTLSCADDPFQLYPRTLAVVLDSDPIGRINPAPGETTFHYAQTFEGRLVLCGDTIQAQVTYDGVLTPLKAGIDVMTQHEMNPLIRPAFVNGKMLISSPKGAAASGIFEIAVDRVTNVPLGEDLTTAAPRYLPAGVDRSATCAVNFMTVYGTSGSADLYVHLYRHSDNERIQNALFRWHLPAGYTLGGMFFVNTVLYLQACQGGQAHLLKMDLSPLALDADPTATIQTYLDFKATEAQCIAVAAITYDVGTDRTTVTLPYPRSNSTVLVVRAPGTGHYSEAYLGHVDAAASLLAGANKLVVTGDFRTVPFYVGHKYPSEWTLTRLYPLDGNKKPLRNGRCQLRKITTDLANTGYIRAEVTNAGRPVQVSEYFGFRWDDPTALFDTAPSATIRWGFPIMAENEQALIKLVNDSPFGFTILGFEWIGEFNPKSQRT